jgi:excisionase family DNA binding protein
MSASNGATSGELAEPVRSALPELYNRPTYYTPKEVASLLRISVRSVYRLVKNDPTVPALNLTGGALRFPRERLEKWLRDREQGRAQPKRLAIVKAEAQ